MNKNNRNVISKAVKHTTEFSIMYIIYSFSHCINECVHNYYVRCSCLQTFNVASNQMECTLDYSSTLGRALSSPKNDPSALF